MKAIGNKEDKHPATWPRKNVIMVLVGIATITLLARSCIDKLSPNGGHFFDDFEVISVDRGPNDNSSILFRYRYAELSSTGYSLWEVEGDAPKPGSNATPNGKALFTWLGDLALLQWEKKSNDEWRIALPANANAVFAEFPSDCFWRNKSDLICLHDERVTIGAATKTPP